MPKAYKDAQANFEKALTSLRTAAQKPPKQPIEVAGLIKLFELSFETGWKALKVFLLKEIGISTSGPKHVFSLAYQHHIISDEGAWLEMLDDRNFSVHVYDQNDAKQLSERIMKKHLSLLESLWQTIQKSR